MEKEQVVLDEIAGSARRIIIRLDIGTFEISGPRANIVRVESLVAFSTTVNELFKEGYEMVSPEEYAGAYGIAMDRVSDKIHVEGSLFLLRYEEHEAVPLEEKAVTDHLGPHLI